MFTSYHAVFCQNKAITFTVHTVNAVFFLKILFVKPLVADRGDCVYLAVSLLCVSCACLFSTSIAVTDTKGL